MIDGFLLGSVCGIVVATLYWLYYYRHHRTRGDFEARIARGMRVGHILLKDLGPEEYHRQLTQVRTAMEELDTLGVAYDVEDATAFAAIYQKETGKRFLAGPVEP